jgi:hypothetical protein
MTILATMDLRITFPVPRMERITDAMRAIRSLRTKLCTRPARNCPIALPRMMWIWRSMRVTMVLPRRRLLLTGKT